MACTHNQPTTNKSWKGGGSLNPMAYILQAEQYGRGRLPAVTMRTWPLDPSRSATVVASSMPA